jgi:hypothetical protein
MPIQIQKLKLQIIFRISFPLIEGVRERENFLISVFDFV